MATLLERLREVENPATAALSAVVVQEGAPAELGALSGLVEPEAVRWHAADCVALRAPQPVHPSHHVLVPLRRPRSLCELRPTEFAAVQRAAALVGARLRDELGGGDMCLFVNETPGEDDAFCVHLLVLPVDGRGADALYDEIEARPFRFAQ